MLCEDLRELEVHRVMLDVLQMKMPAGVYPRAIAGSDQIHK